MAFDLASVLKQAEEVINSNSTSNSNYDGPRLLYPGLGTLSVRLLFNPKSQSVFRLIRRHKVNGKNFICAGTYHQDCPLCVGIDTYKTLTGSTMWTMDSKRLGLVLAQYVGISRDYDTNGMTMPEKGEVVLLMLPWSAYLKLNDVIQRAGEHADELLTKNDGRVINIVKSQGANLMEYTVEVDAFSPAFRSSPTQEEFDQFLMDLPDINEAYCPAEMPEDLLKTLQAEADTLLSKVNTAAAQDARVPDQVTGAQVPPQVVNGAVIPGIDEQAYQQQANVVTKDPEHDSDEGTECFGNFVAKNRKCLMCSRAVDCASELKKNSAN